MKQDIIKYIRKINQKATIPSIILDHFSSHGSSTIPELSKSIGVSLPTATSALNEMMSMGIVKEVGKKDNTPGRTPMVYDLEPTTGYFIGANPEMNYMALSACDFCGNLIVEKTKVPYHYENTPENFELLGNIIEDFIKSLPIRKEDILNFCMNVAERVNPSLGTAYNIYTFDQRPLAKKLTEMLGLPTCIENNTRSMTYGEYMKGCCKGKKDVIFVNVCSGVGIGIIINGELYYGNSGYAGEFGHTPVYNNNIICHCGKLGCIETEVSGGALKRKLTQQILAGKQCILSDQVVNKKKELTLQNILDAIAKEDLLCLTTLQSVAEELGKQLAGVINIFNPEMLVIGGDLSATGDYLTLPVNMEIKKYSLNVMNEDTQIVTSELKGQAGIIGACLMARHNFLTK